MFFQESDVATLQKAIELDEKLSGDVWQIKDEFAVGPIADIYEMEGYQQRREWWNEVLQDSPYNHAISIVDDKLTVHQLTQKIQDENEVCWIWMGQNAHDVCGYYWLMSQLKNYNGKVFILYLNNLPFINEKGQLFYPNNLFQIQPKEFLKAKKLARLITVSEFETDEEEWKKIVQRKCNYPNAGRWQKNSKQERRLLRCFNFKSTQYRAAEAEQIITFFLHQNKNTNR